MTDDELEAKLQAEWERGREWGESRTLMVVERTLRESQAARKMHARTVAEIHVKSGHTLAEVTAECRRLGITRWSDGDTTIELGTEPQAEATAQTQQETDPETLEKRRRASQHATSMSAVGRLVPRFARDE